MKKQLIIVLIILAALGGYLVGGLETRRPNEEKLEEPVSRVGVSLQDGDNFYFLVEPDYESFNLEELTFMAGLGVELSLELVDSRYSSAYYFPKNIEIKATDQTEIETNYGDEISFSELRDMSEGTMGPPHSKVVGEFFTSEGEFFVEAGKIIKTVQ